MEGQQKLHKGEQMEEQLRDYFLSLGFYVARAVEYRYEGNLVTDIDLFLYGRSSSLTRERITVEIKNKKKPQAFERILVVNGLKKLLNFNGCIVATTDQKPILHKFGNLHDTHILDGTFLSKLKKTNNSERLFEEELMSIFAKYKSHKTFPNKDWRSLYQSSKSKLLSEQDFSGFNETIYLLEYFINKSIVDVQKCEDATRMIYIIISHLLLTVDFISKDIAFLETAEREKKFLDGFNFGNLGKDGVDKIVSVAGELAKKSTSSFKKELENNNNQILKDFFSKLEISKNLHNWAKDFEKFAFSREFLNPYKSLPPHAVGVISMFLDFFQISRRTFFEAYNTTIEPSKEEKPKNILNNYKIVGVLSNDKQVTELPVELYNKQHVNITRCIVALTKDNADINTIIYVSEKENNVYAKFPNGKTITFS